MSPHPAMCVVFVVLALGLNSGCAVEGVPQGTNVEQSNPAPRKDDTVWYVGKLSWNTRYSLRVKVEGGLITDAEVTEKEKPVPQSKRTMKEYISVVYSEYTADAIGTADLHVPKSAQKDGVGTFVLLSDRRIDLLPERKDTPPSK